MILRKVVIGITLILSVIHSLGQGHIDLINQGERNFELLKQAFYEKWEQSGQSASELKRFKRWEYLMENRLIDGLIPGPEQYLENRNIFEREKMGRSRQRVEIEPVWKSMGPQNWVSGHSGYSPGLGRVNAMAVNPEDSQNIIIGTASGGVWLTKDGGSTWENTTESFSYLGASDIYFDQNNPNRVWVLTGDGDGADTPSIGILYSQDGGYTWERIGPWHKMEEFMYYKRFWIDPQNTDRILLASASGIDGTVDGGDTWQGKLDIGVSMIVSHPKISGRLYAPKNYESKNGIVTIFVSDDYGETWSTREFDIGQDFTVSRKEIDISHAEPTIIYVLAVKEDGGFGALLSSFDELETLSVRSTAPNILTHDRSGNGEGGQGRYDLALTVSPDDSYSIFTGGINVWKSENGGISWDSQSHWVYDPESDIGYTHADIHMLRYFDNRLWVASDGGIFYSDEDKNFVDISSGLNIGQFYRLGIHPNDPEKVIGGLQDNGSFYMSGNIWTQLYGADGMEAIINFDDPGVVYTSYQNGGIIKHYGDGFAGNKKLFFPENEGGAWVTPYIMDSEDPEILYFGLENVYKTSNGGESFEIIWTDNSTQKVRILKQNQRFPNHLIFNNNNSTYLSTDKGITWKEIETAPLTKEQPTDIAFDQNNPSTIYFSFGKFNYSRRVIVSHDLGKTWSDFSLGLPAIPVNSILSLGDCANTLVAGTEIGVYIRNDTSDEWVYFGEGLPNVSIQEVEFQKETNHLFIATYGRGIWSIDLGEIGHTEILVPGNLEVSVDSEPITVEVSSSLTGEIFIKSLNPELITFEDSIGTIFGAGSAVIEVTQDGTCPAYFTITIDKLNQDISWVQEFPRLLDTQWEFEMFAVASSGLPVMYESENNGILRIEGNKAFIVNYGTTYINAYQPGSVDYKAAEAIRRRFDIYPDREAEILIYPNPFSNNILFIHFPKNLGKSIEVRLYDALGSLIKFESRTLSREDIELYLADLSPGLYILKVNNKSFRVIRY